MRVKARGWGHVRQSAHGGSLGSLVSGRRTSSEHACGHVHNVTLCTRRILAGGRARSLAVLRRQRNGRLVETCENEDIPPRAPPVGGAASLPFDERLIFGV